MVDKIPLRHSRLAASARLNSSAYSVDAAAARAALSWNTINALLSQESTPGVARYTRHPRSRLGVLLSFHSAEWRKEAAAFSLHTP